MKDRGHRTFSNARRAWLGCIAAIVAAPGLAQRAGATPRRVVICLGPTNAPDPIGPVRKAYAKEFASHGLSDGREIEIAILRPRGSEWEPMADDLKRAMSLNPYVIMRPADGDMAMERLLPIVGDTPLVIWGVFDGFEDSIEVLNKRGVNVTGVMHSMIELVEKRFALLKELRPGARRAAIVGKMRGPPTPRQKQIIQRETDSFASAARAAGMELVPMLLDFHASTATTVAELRKARVDVAECPWGSGPEFWDQLAANGIAASGRSGGAAREGALLAGWAVGAVPAAIRLAAKVLRGQRASELPVERLREFRHAINMRTARKLGITVPPTVILQMHEVFE